MALDAGALTTVIKNAMLANIPQSTAQQTTEIETLATAISEGIKDFVLGLTITTLPTTGLAAPDGPVTGALAYTLE